MKKWSGWLLVAGCVLVIGGAYVSTHRRVPVASVAPAAVAPAAEEPTPGPEASYAEARDAQQMVTITGPLADYMARQAPGKAEVVQPVSRKSTDADHVGGESLVDTSRPILHKTFEVATAANLPFEIPAHASSAKLRGTYQTFVKQGGVQSNDVVADVDFSLFNEQQYHDFLAGRPADTLLSADGAQNQEVNFSLPPTIDRPVKYYLVFRNNSRGGGKKFVQADFRVDF